MNVPTPKEYQCDVGRCEERSEFADLLLPPEIANWLTGAEFSRLVKVELCTDHWLQVEEAVQKEIPEKIPAIDPDQCTVIMKGLLPMSIHEPFPWTEYEYWKQKRLKKGRKFRGQKDKTVDYVLEEKDSVQNDAGLSQRLVSMLVDDFDLPFGPAQEAKQSIEAEINALEGISAEVIPHSKADLVIESENSLAAGDIVWIGDDLFDDVVPSNDLPFRKPRRWDSDTEWNVDFFAEFNLKDVLGYSDDSVDMVFRIFIFDSLSKAGFIGMENKYKNDSRAYLSTNSSEIEITTPAIVYSDFVSLPLIDDLPQFLCSEYTFENLQNQRLVTLNDKVPLSKKSYEYLKSKTPSLNIQ
ncbi:hypothetical protein OB919_20455 [Halobacteria archaeon AArc-curdl1]|uniref:Uncharacterized protein n=1 Tax=Natronosalvus hydrolyticus TaxID=2979988 RepID=A0AAP2ZBQ8_9EURY|nr:hypothetical protein [Halobacteria archaeon AArc-curdl1]